ncbi:UNVERIFIED_CONTAM: hypothetical protein K2H54_045112 [Gekko kuhli]
MENGGSVYEPTTSPAEQLPRKGLRYCGCTAAHLGPLRLLLKALQLPMFLYPVYPLIASHLLRSDLFRTPWVEKGKGLSFLAFVLEEVIEVCTRCGGLYFFEFVSCCAFLLCIPILAIYCTSLYERVGKDQVKQLDFWIVAVTGPFFFIASIVFASTSDRTSVEVAAIVFGFFASIMFLADAVMMCFKGPHARKETQQENTDRPLNPAENQPLNNQPV